jgi:hypothetical protein
LQNQISRNTRLPENKNLSFSETDIFDPDKIEVVGGKAQLVLDGTYPTDNPTIQKQQVFNFKDMLAFEENATKPTGTEIKYIFKDGDDLIYWDGSNFVPSDGTYLQANLASDIDSSLSLLSFDNPVALIVFLNSDGSATPVI